MKKRIILFFLLSSFLLTCSCIRKREIKVESDKNIVDKIIREYVSALDSADTDKLLSLYTKGPDITVIGTGDEFYAGYDQVEKFYKDIAIGTGFGTRFDFSFFIFRLDLGIKLKDPVYHEGKRWTFSRPERFERKDFVVNFGIGYPF